MADTNSAATGTRGHQEGARHIRYTNEQIRVLENTYKECSNPNRARREQMMREHPILNGIDNKQLKIWFQNRRRRERKKKENEDILAENKKLKMTNQLLSEENNAWAQRFAATSTSQPQVSFPQPTNADYDKGLLFLADEALNEFLAKATGAAINWVPFPMQELHGMVGEVYVPCGVGVVAARACTIVPFEPLKIIELLKDTPSWCRRCRKLDVLAEYPANHGGTIELVYKQYYAQTTLACARDFWMLRYTSILEDGSFVVCEKSISGGPDVVPSSLEFVRGNMLASGYLIRPCEGGSMVKLVAHMDWEALSVPEVVRPLHESSELTAKEMIVPALQRIDPLASEGIACKINPGHDGDSAFVRSFVKKITRGFNDVVNGFKEDGWQLMNADSPNDAIISMKRANVGSDTNYDGVICMKTTMKLQNVFPKKLVRQLKDDRSLWMDFNFDDKPEAITKACYFAFPGVNTHSLSDNGVLLGHTTSNGDEVLEILGFDNSADILHNGSTLYHLQIVNGMESPDDTCCFGASSELIFAPIIKRSVDTWNAYQTRTSNDDVLLSSGFRFISIGSRMAKEPSAYTMMILAFQFPFETRFEEDVRVIALEYIQHVISSVENICLEMMPSSPNLEYATDEHVPTTFDSMPNSACDFNSLATKICQSFSSYLGVEMFDLRCPSNGTFLELVQNHQYAILCFSFASPPTCIFANQSAVVMLGTGLHILQRHTLDQIFDGSNMSLSPMIPTITHQRYATLPQGCILSMTNRRVSYEQGVVWRVDEPDGSCHCFAIAFINWSFY